MREEVIERLEGRRASPRRSASQRSSRRVSSSSAATGVDLPAGGGCGGAPRGPAGRRRTAWMSTPRSRKTPPIPACSAIACRFALMASKRGPSVSVCRKVRSSRYSSSVAGSTTRAWRVGVGVEVRTRLVEELPRQGDTLGVDVGDDRHVGDVRGPVRRARGDRGGDDALERTPGSSRAGRSQRLARARAGGLVEELVDDHGGRDELAPDDAARIREPEGRRLALERGRVCL